MPLRDPSAWVDQSRCIVHPADHVRIELFGDRTTVSIMVPSLLFQADFRDFGEVFMPPVSEERGDSTWPRLGSLREVWERPRVESSYPLLFGICLGKIVPAHRSVAWTWPK